ncbi:MAG: response regulator transcription factor [Candidatus Hodarchaeota archaeon]
MMAQEQQRQCKLFIVEDDPYMVELYSKMVRFDRRFKIVGIAMNGEEAVEKLEKLQVEENPPDVVIMDHRLPLKTGVEATKEILDFSPKVRIIFASADRGAREDAFKIGAINFLQKPFSLRTLFQSILEAFEKDMIAEQN